MPTFQRRTDLILRGQIDEAVTGYLTPFWTRFRGTFYQITTDQPGKASWPLTNPTYILMYKTQDKPANASNALKFFDWAFTNGDKAADDLDYVPLPDSVKALVRKQWETQIKDASGKPVAFK